MITDETGIRWIQLGTRLLRRYRLATVQRWVMLRKQLTARERTMPRIRTELPDQYRAWVRAGTAAAAVGYAAIGMAALVMDEGWLHRSELPAVVLCVVAFWLQAHGRLDAAVATLLGAVWLEAHWALATSEQGIRSAAGIPLVGLVVGAVPLVGSRVTLLMNSVTTFSIPAALLLGRALGLGPGIPLEDALHYGIVVLTMWVCLAVLHVFVGSFETVLERAQRDERRMSELVQGSPDAMIALDAGGFVESFNSAAERLVGTTAEQAIGQRFVELPLSAPAEAGLDEIGSGPRELLADRSGRTLEALFRPTTRQDGTAGELVVLRDVTERKRAERKAHELQHQLLHSQKLEAVGLLAGGVAHEFNNLLTAVSGYGSFLDASADPVAHGIGQELLTVQERGVALTRQLLGFARKEVPQPRTTELCQVVRDTRPLLRRLLGERIELELSVSPPCPVFVDPGQVEQVLLNLAANARDAMPQGGTLRISCRARAEVIELGVCDTGTGILPDLRERIFEPFFTTKPRGQGTGLGLSSVRSIVDGSGGLIDVDSQVGSGTTFRVSWPRCSQTAGQEPPSVPALAAGAGKGRVLVVEDDQQAGNVLRRALESGGYQVTVSSSGEEALERAQRELPDLLLSDVMLPGMTGVDLAVRLRKEHPDLPVLFVSGYLHDVLDDAPFDPVTDLLPKPFNVPTLLRTVATKLRGQS